MPAEVPFEEAAALRERDPEGYVRLARESIVAHVRAMTELLRQGSFVFDYGNNLRGEAQDAGFLTDIVASAIPRLMAVGFAPTVTLRKPSR